VACTEKMLRANKVCDYFYTTVHLSAIIFDGVKKMRGGGAKVF
jgi:hypothetical protein